MSEPTIRLGFDRDDKLFLITICAVVGAGLGFAIAYVATWAADLRWIPFQGPLQLIGSSDFPWAIWARPTLGLLLGLSFAAYCIHQSPVLHISAETIEVTSGGNTGLIDRSAVADIYCDGGKLVIQSHTGRRLFHGHIEGKREAARDAFVSFGYPWETTMR